MTRKLPTVEQLFADHEEFVADFKFEFDRLGAMSDEELDAEIPGFGAWMKALLDEDAAT